TNKRLQSSSILSMGKSSEQEGNQRWGEASICQSSPIWERCQRRTGACGRWGGVGWAQPFWMAQWRTWARSSLKECRRKASEAAKLYGQGGEQERRFLRRSVTGSGQTAAWSPPEVPG